MLTPPYDFAIVAAPGPGAGLGGTPGGSGDDTTAPSQILYRGSLPAARNAPFLRRLGIRTLVAMRKKPLAEDEPLAVWARRRGIEVLWVRAEKMGEESLGMERAEVGQALQILLNPSAYPIYLADVDGKSHTTLVVACLRKLQGWEADSIEQEIYRFEPDHDDFPLVPFITSYLSMQKDEALALPSPPYPAWLWPSVPETRSRERERERERAASGITGLPFPNPLTARRHPSMRLTFPAAPSPASKRAPSAAPLSRIATIDRRPGSPKDDLTASPLTYVTALDPSPPQSQPQSQAQSQSRSNSQSQPQRMPQVSFDSPIPVPAAQAWSAEMGIGESPEVEERLLDDEDDDMDEDEDEAPCGSDEEEDFDDDYDEDEDEEEEEEPEAVSQYISALDLAGYG